MNAYQEIAKLVGFSNYPDTENEEYAFEYKSPYKLVSPSETRWFVVSDCIERILGQYDALGAHFCVAYAKGKCYKTGHLSNIYKDEQN